MPDPRSRCITWLSLLALLHIASPTSAQRTMERMDRGAVAVQTPEGVFVSWRLLANEDDDLAFDVFRIGADGRRANLHEAPLKSGTNFLDEGHTASTDDRYVVQIHDADDQVPLREAVTPVWSSNYHEIPIDVIPGYRPGDMSVGDLDGDGQYEFVLHQISRARDNSHAGITGKPILDAYKWNGDRLWRIDLGVNIREGEHYTQFMVYDFDGDGMAEVACKTADGTIDGLGNVIGDGEKDWRELDEDSRSFGRVLNGPEFLTVFDGRTGEALQTVDYVPGRSPIDGWGGIGGNGGNDSYGNRCDRFLACVAYLDGDSSDTASKGSLPSLITCRGVYGRIVIVAWDWRDQQLRQRWVFDSGISYPPFENASEYSGMGGHSLSVADVDADGRDEIVYQAMVIDDDGTGLYSTGLRHGDAMHISDMYPQRPGLEVFTVQENEDATVRFQTPGAAMRDARTGELLWSHSPGVDVPSGLAADIDPRYPGYEAWGGPGGLRIADGSSVGTPPRSSGYAIWWDGDLLRELVSRTRITKWNWMEERQETIFSVEGRGAPRGPNLIADLCGDWREEMIMASPEMNALRIYTTTIPTEHRIYTLMQDPQYRLGIAWQNVVYNKPAHPSFFLGHNMSPPPKPTIRVP